MEFREVVRRRRMVRRYEKGRPVADDVLRRCLENALRAPSAGFSQGWNFLVLRSDQERELVWGATTEPGAADDPWLSGIRSAPVLVLCLSDKNAYLDRYAEPDKGWADRDEARWPVPYWDIDTGMAALLILLTAVDEGLGGLFFGVPPERHPDVHRAFSIPDEQTIVGVVSLGHPSAGPKSPSLRRHRRGVDEVVHWGRFARS
jgi:nitroreductase